MLTEENKKIKNEKLAKIHREIDNILETGEKGKVIIFVDCGEITGQETVISRKYQ